MKAMIAAALTVAGALGASSVGAQSTPEIMRKKMGLAQELLEAVVLQEYDIIRDHGGELDSLAEFQSWFVLPTPEYAQHSREFREAAQAVRTAGESKDLDAASDAYATMFKKCVQCHAYMSRVREATGSR